MGKAPVMQAMNENIPENSDKCATKSPEYAIHSDANAGGKSKMETSNLLVSAVPGAEKVRIADTTTTSNKKEEAEKKDKKEKRDKEEKKDKDRKEKREKKE